MALGASFFSQSERRTVAEDYDLAGDVEALELFDDGAAPNPVLLDDFNGNSINLALWSRWGSAAKVVQQNQRLTITITAGLVEYQGMEWIEQVDITGKAIGSTLLSAGNQALTSWEAYVLGITFATNYECYWYITSNTLYCFTNINGVFNVRGSALDYDPLVHKYFAIGERSGDLVAWWSTDAVTWTKHVQFTNPFTGDVTVQPYFMVGTNFAEASTSTMEVDDLAFWDTASLLDLTAGGFPGNGGGSKVSLVMNYAADEDPASVLAQSGRASLALDSASTAEAAPASTGTSKAALVTDLASTLESAPVIAAGGKATLTIVRTDSSTTQPIVVGGSKVALGLDYASGAEAQPTMAGSGNATLAVERQDAAGSYPVVVQAGNASLGLSSAADVDATPVIVGAGRANLTLDFAVTAKPGTGVIDTPSITWASDLSVVVKNSQGIIASGGLTRLWDLSFTGMTTSVLPGVGGVEFEALGPDATNLELFAGSVPGLLPAAGRASLVLDFAATAKPQPVTAAVGRMGPALDLAVGSKPQSLSVALSRSVLAMDLAVNSRAYPVLHSASGITSAANWTVAVLAAVVPVYASGEVLSAQNLSVDVDSAVVLVGIGTQAELTLASTLTLWTGTEEVPLILLGVWDGTVIRPAITDGIV